METRIESRERYFAERRELARFHRQLILWERRELMRMGMIPAVQERRTWRGEKRAFREGFGRHLRGFALEFGREVLKTVGLR
jgi:hypothetical protein